MGLVLLADLFRRWRWLKEFYSNDGVLPNHNHLFNLREVGRVWSIYHAFSTPGENHFAFAVTLLVYVAFLVGFRTRAFHIVSLLCLVSLASRNILLENAGTYAAIALLAFTAFLPLGSRFSVDALRASLAARDEKDAAALNDRSFPSPELVAARRLPGWSPVSLAALAVLLQIAIIHLATALQQDSDAWRSGTALYYALHVERWVSHTGAHLRSLPPGVLAAGTYALRGIGFLVPALILLPVLRRRARMGAAALVLLNGLAMGLLFSFGLYGWTLCAAAALLVPAETWDALAASPDPRRMLTVIYDADCGVCLWLCRILQRLDVRGQLTFQGNDDITSVKVRKLGGKAEKKAARRASLYRLPALASRKPPPGLTEELVLETVVAIGPEGEVWTHGRAVAEIRRALPFGWLSSWILRAPGISHGLDALYRVVAARRQDISVWMGKEACGVPVEGEEAPGADADLDASVPPATFALRALTAAVREGGAAVVLLAMLVQTGQANDLPSAMTLPQSQALASVAAWPRMLARWDILVDPPDEDAIVVVDAQTKGGLSVDTLTGGEPEFDPAALRGNGLGQLWNDFLYRIRLPDLVVFPSHAHPVVLKNDFLRMFRDYMNRAGPRWDEKTGDNAITGLDAYWVKRPIVPPGVSDADVTPTREKLFTQLRGGRVGLDRPLQNLPILPPAGALKPRL
jgi:predicted DCC family thiol-disulfide oxidoreductase YuxK